MTEPRMRLRQKGQQFSTQDLEAFLIAYGDSDNPLPETVKVLDEIITDYIIETCHEAAAVAHHARRAKIKLEDFKFMLRRDTTKLGRLSEMLERDKLLKTQRKLFDENEGAVAGAAKGAEKEGVDREEEGAEEGEEGRRKKGASKARSESGRSRIGGKRKEGEGEREGDEGRKKKRKKNKEKEREDAGSVRGR
ncbi:TFIID-18kDa-domain-containing protein [Westerdykella ornata]|uniref:Transcription initiation factor TFIID subunit 13 n=1 Tax=Westerdykella ornata TaxID=318751 RepID=A0A6A6JVZ3_WESOR|nr:TFIID-18kDa-domain-containing protein [Westerdykella ornata]KAF2280567.1 TFIID-18kDa-domain-containing protein [Westerdykella ornata]